MVTTLNNSSMLGTNETPQLIKARDEVSAKLCTIRINDQSKAVSRVFVTTFNSYGISPYHQQYLFSSIEYLFVAIGRERFKDFMTTHLPAILAFQTDEAYKAFDDAKKRESAEVAVVKKQMRNSEH